MPPDAEDRRPLVLIVDDDPGMRDTMADLLDASGFRPLVASSGEEALSRCQSGLPRLVLSDIRMPGMNGLELALQVRERWPDVPVLLMTAYTEQQVREEAARHGISVFSKPLDVSSLLVTLWDVVGESRGP